LGGTKGTGHAKRARPLAPRTTYHIVLRSEKARGTLSMLRKKHKNPVSKIIHHHAKRFYVKIESYANVGNHLHIKAYAQSCEEFRNFLRTITCLIARKVTGAARNKKFGKFWDGLTFTRMLRSFAEHEILKRYIFANILQTDCGTTVRENYLMLWYRPDQV
jgi:REP element-mobilizing transposase RayT